MSFRLDIYIHQDGDHRLERIEAKLDRLIQKESVMSQVVDDVLAEVEATKAGEESALALLDQLFAIVEANASDPAQLQQAISDLKAEREKLAAAVMTDTPPAA